MTDFFYETKESTAEGFRAVVVTPFEHGNGRVDFVTLDDEHHIISLEDLAFLARAVQSLPRELLEPITVRLAPQPQAVADTAADMEAKRPGRAGGRWTEDQEVELEGMFKNGLNANEIAKRMDRSPASIVSRLLKLDLVEVRPKG